MSTKAGRRFKCGIVLAAALLAASGARGRG